MKKLFAVILSAIMLMTTAMAASPADMLDTAWNAGRSQTVEISFSASDMLLTELGDEELDGAIGDLLDVLSFVAVTGQQGPWKVGMHLDGTDVLSFQGESVNGVHYLASPILGSQPIAATDEDLMALGNFLIQKMVESGEITMKDGIQAQAAIAMIPQLIAEMDSAEMPEFDVSPLLPVIAELAQRFEQAEPYQLNDMDQAASCQILRLTPEDMGKVFTAFVAVLESAPEFMNAAFADVNDPHGELMSFFDEFYDFLDDNNLAVYLVLQQDDAQNIVHIGIYMAPDTNDNVKGAAAEAWMTINYKRQTAGAGATHIIEAYAASDDGKETVQAKLFVDIDNVAKQTVSFNVSATENGKVFKEIEVKWTAENDYGTIATERGVISITEDTTGSGYGMKNVVAFEYDVIGRMNGKDAEVVTKVTLKGNDMEVGSVTVKTTTGDPLPTLATGNDVRIAPMIINADFDNPNDPLNKYVESLSDNAMTTMMLLMQKLPMSVLMLVMQ